MSLVKTFTNLFKKKSFAERAMDEAVGGLKSVMNKVDSELNIDALFSDVIGSLGSKLPEYEAVEYDGKNKSIYKDILGHSITGLGQLNEAVTELKECIEFVELSAESEQWESRSKGVAIDVINHLNVMDSLINNARKELGSEIRSDKYTQINKTQNEVLQGILEEIDEQDYQAVLGCFKGHDNPMKAKVENIWAGIQEQGNPESNIVVHTVDWMKSSEVELVEAFEIDAGHVVGMPPPPDLDPAIEGLLDDQSGVVKNKVRPLLYLIKDVEEFTQRLESLIDIGGQVTQDGLNEIEGFYRDNKSQAEDLLAGMNNHAGDLPGELKKLEITAKTGVVLSNLQNIIEETRDNDHDQGIDPPAVG